jgi:hypothetical protein
MPNHITNILKAPASVIEALKHADNLVDFNTMIPMPEALREVTVNGDEHLVELLNGKLALNPGRDDILGSLTLSNVLRDLQSGGMTKWDDKRFENFVTMLRGYREHGCASWYDFGCERWGTKWNAYSIEAVEGGIKFETAWSAPHPVIAKLAERFPDEKIEHSWADEDIGSNLGMRVYHFGGVTDLPIEDPLDFALTLNGDDREYYRKSPTTGKWESHDFED